MYLWTGTRAATSTTSCPNKRRDIGHQATVGFYGWSPTAIGRPIMLPHSVHEPS
jgi:hypothetical protein